MTIRNFTKPSTTRFSYYDLFLMIFDILIFSLFEIWLGKDLYSNSTSASLYCYDMSKISCYKLNFEPKFKLYYNKINLLLADFDEAFNSCTATA